MYGLRRLGAADRAEFRALRLIALQADPDNFIVTATEERAIERLSIEDALEKPRGDNFILGAFLKEKNTLVGIAALITTPLLKGRHCGHVRSVFVDPAHRRHGLARQLITNLIEGAEQSGLRYARLEVVAENEGAVTLYESLGFSAYGREPGAYRLGDREWDVLLMTRKLRNADA